MEWLDKIEPWLVGIMTIILMIVIAFFGFLLVEIFTAKKVEDEE